MSNTIFYSRSATVQDWKCQRSRYLGYEAEGRGYAAPETPLALALGIMLHDGMAAIAANLPIDEIIKAGNAQLREAVRNTLAQNQDSADFIEEQVALGEGILRGYHRHIWPKLMSEYDIVDVEKELLYPHNASGQHDPESSVIFMAKPDLLLRHKESDDLIYLEYKSTSSVKDQWMVSWQYAVQLHSTVRAIETTLGCKVAKVVVQGLNKGYQAYNKQNSPFCYLYHKAGVPPFNKDIWAYEYKAGLKKYPTWQRSGGVKQVIAEMPEAMLSQQFPQTPPIFINEDLVDAFFRQRYVREHTIRDSRAWLLDPNVNPEEKQQIMDANFAQNFEACSPGWGVGCDFKRICHGNVQDPLLAGWQLRTSHHDAEREQHEG